jgi:hypothetical protein
MLQTDPLRLPSFHFDADPDPAFHFEVDPDPTFQFSADPGPDQASQNDADPCRTGFEPPLHILVSGNKTLISRQSYFNPGKRISFDMGNRLQLLFFIHDVKQAKPLQ